MRELSHFSFWLVRTYARGVKPADGTAFNPDLLPKTSPIPPQTLAQLQKLAAQLAEKDTKLSEVLTGKAALDAAKARGVVLGGNRGGLNDAARAMAHQRSIEMRQQQAAKRKADLVPIIEAIRASGAMTLQQIADGLNERGIPAARGGAWQPAQVMRVTAAEAKPLKASLP